jgi:hypothetical protein
METAQSVFVRCKKCPYAQGLVNPAEIPCKYCRTNNFIMFDVFSKQISINSNAPDKKRSA